MTTRLNAEIRAGIIKAAIEKAGIPNEKIKLKTMRAEWAEACRIEAFGGADEYKKVQKTLAKISALNESLTGFSRFDKPSKRYKIETNLAGLAVDAYFSGDISYYNNTMVSKPAPSEMTILGGTELHTQWLEIEAFAKDLTEREESIKQDVKV